MGEIKIERKGKDKERGAGEGGGGGEIIHSVVRKCIITKVNIGFYILVHSFFLCVCNSFYTSRKV